MKKSDKISLFVVLPLGIIAIGILIFFLTKNGASHDQSDGLSTAKNGASHDQSDELSTAKNGASHDQSDKLSTAKSNNTENSEISVVVLGVQKPKDQSINISNNPLQRQTITPKQGSHFIHVKLSITPKTSSNRIPLANDLADFLVSSVYREGDWLFTNLIAKFQAPVGSESWLTSIAVSLNHTDVQSGTGKATNEYGTASTSASLMSEVGMITVYSLAVKKTSVITLVYAVPENATEGTLRIDGCEDLKIKLNEWGEWD